MAPGIGDDSLGLASLLAWARALDAAKVATKRGILFVATVGEEGAGDLRGVRHLFTKSRYKDRIGAFLSVDTSDPARIVNGAVGSRRYRLAFTGPGGTAMARSARSIRWWRWRAQCAASTRSTCPSRPRPPMPRAW
jgi:acetylornithine deacetylase/succinyl-diaminopimelate desuccinylase-like protein